MYYVNHLNSKLNFEYRDIKVTKELSEYFEHCVHAEIFYYNQLVHILCNRFKNVDKVTDLKQVVNIFRKNRDDMKLVFENGEKITNYCFLENIPSNTIDTAAMQVEIVYNKFLNGKGPFPSKKKYPHKNSKQSFTICNKSDSFKFGNKTFKFPKCPHDIKLSTLPKSKKIYVATISYSSGKWDIGFGSYPSASNSAYTHPASKVSNTLKSKSKK